jgi:MoaA/NifB/PqqE/SkfB family radical SAM enzyme
MSSPQEIRTIAENLVNIVIKKKYEDVNYVKISLDMDYDIPTYKIYVITKRYEAIYKEKEIVKDIKDTIKMVGISRRELENIIFAQES